MGCNLKEYILFMQDWYGVAIGGGDFPYSLIAKKVQMASQAERDELKTPYFRDQFANMDKGQQGVTGILNDLKFDLKTRILWYHAMQKDASQYGDIQPWIGGSGPEAKATLSDREVKSAFMDICDKSDLLVAVQDIDLTLGIALAWLKAKEESSEKYEYAEIETLLRDCDDRDRQSLESNPYARKFMVDHTRVKQMDRALQLIQPNLKIKLEWAAESWKAERGTLHYIALKKYIVEASQTDRNGLNSGQGKAKDYILEACDERTIVEALKDLNFDMSTRLMWLENKNVSLSQQEEGGRLDYGTAVSPIISGADDEGKEYLGTQTGQDRVLNLGKGESVTKAVEDLKLNLPLKALIHRVWQGTRDIESVLFLVEEASQGQRNTVWKDGGYMAETRSLLGDDYYLSLICALRMRYPTRYPLESVNQVDTAIKKYLNKYLSGSPAEGFNFDGNVAIVNADHWDIAGSKQYGERWADKKGKLGGFVDREGRAFVHCIQADEGTMMHEAIHQYSNESIGGAINVLSHELNEGITEYFTRRVCRLAGISTPYRGSYPEAYLLVKLMVNKFGVDIVGNAYFKGPPTILENTFMDKYSGSGNQEEKKNKWADFINYISNDQWVAAKAILNEMP